MNDDIEILDIFEKKEEKPVVKTVIQNNKEIKNDKPKKKKRKVKGKAWQILFCSVSALFILGCIIYYGSRFIKYYRIYNPKVDSSSGETLLSNGISGNSEIVYEGKGLYIASGNYLYKGDVDNNYVKYNNMLWRIVKINKDNTIDIILDDYINILPWNSEITNFSKSEIYNYLNNEFLNNLDTKMLVKTSFCDETLEDLTKTNCDVQKNDNYVRLLDVASFLNSVKDKKSYLVNSDEIIWLSDFNKEKVWHTNGTNVSQSNANTFYEVKPVVKLKNTVTYKEGDGTIDKPYIVNDNKELKLGSEVLLGEDKWIVYDMSDNVRLMKKEVLSDSHIYDKNSFKYDVDSEESLAKYLNTTYLDSLSYKNLIVNATWYTGSYKDNIGDIKKDKVTTKIGIPSLLDIKLDSKINEYYLLTNNGEALYVYENPLRPSRVTSMRKVRPCIAISKDDANKLKYSDGIFKMEG